MKFDLPLLQAISDWQQGGNARAKYQRGLRLKTLCRNVDSRFRICKLLAFRRLSLNRFPLWNLLADGSLKETISAWTCSIDMAKNFKGGVPPLNWQGIILERLPSDDSVIINLSVLFHDESFQSAIEKYKTQIAEFNLGMGKYMNSQSEVVLEISKVGREDIHGLGGYTSDPNEIGKWIFGREPSDKEIARMTSLLQKGGRNFGPWWLDGEAKDRVLKKVISHVPRLKEKKKRQDANRKRAPASRL